MSNNKYLDAVKLWLDAYGCAPQPQQPFTSGNHLVAVGVSAIKAIPETLVEKQRRDHAMWLQYLRNSAERERDKDPVKSFWCAASVYHMGAISSTDAARLCGLSRVGFLLKLPSVGVPISNLTVEDLDNEFDYLHSSSRHNSTTARHVSVEVQGDCFTHSVRPGQPVCPAATAPSTQGNESSAKHTA